MTGLMILLTLKKDFERDLIPAHTHKSLRMEAFLFGIVFLLERISD